jgi:uncharacterized repeat protein (TIGR03803 family)
LLQSKRGTNVKITKANCIPGRGYSLVLLLIASLFSIPVQGSQFTINSLFTFTCDATRNCPNGEVPNSLIQSADGNFYGTTAFGGSESQAAGTVFKLTPDGEITTIFTFTNDQNGANPSSLVEGNDGSLYGLSILPKSNGTAVFKLSKAGEIKIISSDFEQNAYNLLLANDGNFYVCTLDSDPTPGQVLRIAPSGSVMPIHTFNTSNLGLEGPACLGMIVGADGNLYGTTLGGQTLHTSVFRLTPAGGFTILHTIDYSEFPVSAPTQTSDGRIRGVVSHISGTLQPAMFSVDPSGANYEEIPLFYGMNSALAPFVSFMTQPSDANLWGVLSESVVSFTLKGALLDQLPYNGTGSPAMLLQASNGTLIGLGTSESLGFGELGNGPGEIFTVDAGLSAPAPLFVHSRQSGGKVGSQVMIQGSHFIGARVVTFNGVRGNFKVLNTGNIQATVPQGATTGPIAVTNAGGTTHSKTNFVVE